MCCEGRDVEKESAIGDQDRPRSLWRGEKEQHHAAGVEGLKKAGISMLAGLFIMAGGGGGEVGGVAAALAEGSLVEPTSSVTVQDLQRYDGFEDYAAQGQQMENSDVGCFANECKRETASCFTDGSCLKVTFVFATDINSLYYPYEKQIVLRVASMYVLPVFRRALFGCSCVCSSLGAHRSRL